MIDRPHTRSMIIIIKNKHDSFGLVTECSHNIYSFSEQILTEVLAENFFIYLYIFIYFYPTRKFRSRIINTPVFGTRLSVLLYNPDVSRSSIYISTFNRIAPDSDLLSCCNVETLFFTINTHVYINLYTYICIDVQYIRVIIYTNR